VILRQRELIDYLRTVTAERERRVSARGVPRARTARSRAPSQRTSARVFSAGGCEPLHAGAAWRPGRARHAPRAGARRCARPSIWGWVWAAFGCGSRASCRRSVGLRSHACLRLDLSTWELTLRLPSPAPTHHRCRPPSPWRTSRCSRPSSTPSLPSTRAMRVRLRAAGGP